MNTDDTSASNGPQGRAANDDSHAVAHGSDGAANGSTVVPLHPHAAAHPEEIPAPRVPQDGPGTELARDEAITGELVSERQSRALDRRLARQATAWARTVPRQAVRLVRESERPKQTGKALVRHGLVLCQGFESWGKRAWDATTLGVYRRQIKAAEATGDREMLREWTERKEHAVEARHQRLMDLPRLAAGLAKVTVGSLLGCVVAVLLIGLFVQLSGTGAFVDVITGVMNTIRWVFTAIAVAWTPLVMATPFAVLFAAWREGRRRGTAPGWLATAREADTDAAIDESTIAKALEALRIPQVTAYLKQGLPLQFITPARIDGRGTHAVIRLPAGVTADKVARRRADLATGLRRLAKEVWPTTGAEAGILDLWVADKGALAEGAGAYPLLDEGTADVFQGVPFGKTLRGQPLAAPMMERNTITGGMPGQGKSSAARVMMCGAALDPTAELRIWVPDANFDFEAFRPRCSRYVMGAEDERVAEITEHLRELHEEVQGRGELLIKHEAPSVTRELASKNVGLHPLFCLLEEAHVAIQHPTYGKEVSKLLCDIVRLGRKRAIHLIVSTQAPTKDSMPRDVTRNCSNGIAFAVGDHVANDALLGQGAYSAGHRATELIPGTDKGTAVVKGFTGERSDIVQVYFLDVDRKNDQVSPIIDRAMAAVAERGSLPGSDKAAPQPASRDLLTDLDAVLGEHPVPVADVPALLAAHAPDWAPYRKLTGKALRSVLDRDHGIKVPSTGNKFPLDPVTVRDALARREADEHDETG
ncbi:cell division protein FtsK [Haloechinothrix sp. YIM 98757]|uniref:Cell division protein FtsK n=1 Tax=Haloechinothrix aidingensis TaxID=2752311 RepID=A0A838ADP1_9PSEU|nr:cell division protein FtsK [Haloechinothrix aidingensis]MBA0127307.1 cell division protein FtsK [Haloechinothrix aidingensis]